MTTVKTTIKVTDSDFVTNATDSNKVPALEKLVSEAVSRIGVGVSGVCSCKYLSLWYILFVLLWDFFIYVSVGPNFVSE